MIQLEYAYTGIPIEVEANGEPAAADSTPTAVLYRNGAPTSVVVTVAATAVTGLYTASFTSLGGADGWAKTDRLFIRASAVVSGKPSSAIVWNSFNESDAVMRGTDDAATAVRTELAPELARIDVAVSSRSTVSAIRTEFAIELGRIDENISAPKTLTAATMSTLFDDSDAAQQLTDFFAGLIARFDDAGDTPVATIAAAMLAGLVSHPDWIELLSDAEAARATSVANANAIANLPIPLDAAQTQAAAAAALIVYDGPTRDEATTDKDEILSAITTGGGGSNSIIVAGSITLGPISVTINVTDGTNPIPSAQVTVLRVGERLTTPINPITGSITLPLGSGEWSIRTNASGYESDITNITVTEDTTVSITLTEKSLPVLPAPINGVCVVTGFIVTKDDTPITGAVFEAVPSNTSIIENETIVYLETVSEKSIDGISILSLRQGARYNILVSYNKISITKFRYEVPFQDTDVLTNIVFVV